MRSLYLVCVGFALAACSSSSDNTMQTITIAADAMPCYNAVVAATTNPTGQTNATKALNAANTMVTNVSCVALDNATVSVISSLVNSGTTPTVTPASGTAVNGVTQ